MTPDEKVTAIRQKIHRAKKHLADLETERDRVFAEDNPCEFVSYDDPDTGKHVFEMVRVDPVPASIGLIAGDVLHNARCALDHLVYQLALDHGCISDQIMFPVFKDSAKCIAMNTGKVKGLPQSVKDIIRRAEPYPNGKGRLLWVLEQLDIADKHHALLTHTVCMGGSLRLRHNGIATFGGSAIKFGEPLKAGDKFFAISKSEGYNKVHFSFDIGISEPKVIENFMIVMLLRNIISSADNLILSCKAELK